VIPQKDHIGLRRSLHADIVNVAVTREDFRLLFGNNRFGCSAQGGSTIQFTDQVILSPFSAKRFAVSLDKTIRKYEAEYGFLTEETPREAVSRLPLPKECHPVETSEEKANHLFQLVLSLDVHCGLENSFKVLNQILLRNRFLLGFKKDKIPMNRREKIVDICKNIDMPGDFLEMFSDKLSEANIVLFGYEEGEKGSVYKAYLEFGGGFEKVIMENPRNPSPFLIHLGFKWDASDNSRHALARYTCYPSFSVETILERLSGFYDARKSKTPFEIAKGIIELASHRIGPDEFLYLEVAEENNPRRSFDVNIYRANLRLQELYPWLLKMCRYYSISPVEFHNFYDRVKSLIFGHLSGGIDREGRDFLTVYFGVRGSTRQPAFSRH
jgi:hypothetical protein